MTEERSILQWCRESFELARSKGWHPAPAGAPEHFEPERLASRLALIHSEVSEALECVTRDRMRTYEGEHGKPEGFGPELADIALRLFDLAYSTGVDLEVEIARKHAYNTTRPLRHGGKRLPACPARARSRWRSRAMNSWLASAASAGVSLSALGGAAVLIQHPLALLVGLAVSTIAIRSVLWLFLEDR